MKTNGLFQYLPKKEDWTISLMIMGNDEVSITYMVLDSELNIVLQHTLGPVPFKEAWQEAIAFCKYYKIDRDKDLVKARRQFDRGVNTFNEGILDIDI